MSAPKIMKNPLPDGRMRQSESASSRLFVLDPQVRNVCASHASILCCNITRRPIKG